MKIGLVLDDSLDKPDGVQQFVLTLGHWLTKQGHEVYYIASQTNRADITNLHSVAKNITVRFNKNRLAVPLPASNRKLKEIKALGLDILHVQLPYSPLMSGRILCHLPKTVARVGTFHIMPASKLSILGTELLGKLQIRCLSKFTFITATSQPAAQFATRYGSIKALVVPNPIDMKSFVAKKQPSAKTKIVFLGRLVERKGCLELLKAISVLPKEFLSNLDVIISGKGPLDAKLKSFVRDQNLNNTVRFTGFIAESDKRALLASADIAVFPATGGESFGIVLLEAMAAGAGVVLAGNNPGYASVMQNNDAVLIDASNTQLFADKIAALLTDKSKAQELHNWQQELVKQFDIEVVGRRFIYLYADAIAKTTTKGA